MVQQSCKYLINIIIIKKCDDALTGQNFFIKINWNSIENSQVQLKSLL